MGKLARALIPEREDAVDTPARPGYKSNVCSKRTFNKL
jgi:hypothetical protein